MDPYKTHASKSEKRENEASTSKKRLEPEYPEKKRKGSQDTTEYDITKDNGFQYQRQARAKANLYFRSSGYFDANEKRIESATIEVNTKHSDLSEKEMFPLKLIAYTKPFYLTQLDGTFSAKVQLKNDYLRQIDQKQKIRDEDETRPIFVVNLNIDPIPDNAITDTIESFYKHITKRKKIKLADQEFSSMYSEYIVAMFFELFINSVVEKTEIEFGKEGGKKPDFILNIFGRSCHTEITRISYMSGDVSRLLDKKLNKFDHERALIVLCVLCSSEAYTIEALDAYEKVVESYRGTEKLCHIVTFFFDIQNGSFLF
ncbi:hypothetical protein BgiBS90_027849 [Biomphalaria glabrata]|nr:hypothetical protein BgiBS90_027849 [Biomphalaria glabrata]